MVRRLGVLGGVIALLAVAAGGTSAAAAPVFYTKAVVGAVAPHVPFTGTLGAAFLEPASGSKITCKAGTAAGEVTGPTTTSKSTTTFTGCEASGFKCNSAGEGEGVIKTKTLTGSLGGVTTSLPGIRLFNEAEGRGAVLAEFACAGGAITVVVKGSVIGSFSGASGTEAANGKIPSSGKLTFAESKGVQKYTKFVEGEVGTEQLQSSTNGASFENAGQSVIATLTSVPAGNLGGTK